MSKLTIIPTPVGNLEDITLRALKTLKEVDLLLCEDTRHTAKLLQHYEISVPVKAFHMHNEHKVLEEMVTMIAKGKHLGLVSDAGTPGISDPGFLLSRACAQADITVECLPGPTAFVPALVGSGLPCNEFTFIGFLPPKKGRKTKLATLKEIQNTIVLYESPYKIYKTLKQLEEIFPPETPIVVAREISKIHETFHRGTLETITPIFESGKVKGEMVIMISPLKN